MLNEHFILKCVCFIVFVNFLLIFFVFLTWRMDDGVHKTHPGVASMFGKEK